MLIRIFIIAILLFAANVFASPGVQNRVVYDFDSEHFDRVIVTDYKLRNIVMGTSHTATLVEVYNKGEVIYEYKLSSLIYDPKFMADDPQDLFSQLTSTGDTLRNPSFVGRPYHVESMLYLPFVSNYYVSLIKLEFTHEEVRESIYCLDMERDTSIVDAEIVGDQFIVTVFPRRFKRKYNLSDFLPQTHLCCFEFTSKLTYIDGKYYNDELYLHEERMKLYETIFGDQIE